MLNNNLQKNRAFVLLYAVLVSSLVLAVGISLISIALKQLALSSSGRESQYAFYASNTGIECALYWDFVGTHEDSKPVFALNDTTETLFEDVEIEDEGLVYCGVTPISIEQQNVLIDTSPNSATTTFSEISLSGTDYCFTVTVEKYLDEDGKNRTTIESRGYNTCDIDNARRVERGLRVTY